MNKRELASRLAVKNMITKREAEKVLNDMLDIISEALSDGDSVNLVGFGSFEVKQRKGHNAANPQKPGETIYVESSRVASFKMGSNLKSRL